MQLSARAGEPRPSFAFFLAPCPGVIDGPPRDPVLSQWEAILESRDLSEDAPGAQGWSISIAADGVEVVAGTTRGTLAAGEWEDPPGLRVEAGFHVIDLARPDRGIRDCEGLGGIVSGVVLSLISEVTLPPTGAQTVLRFTVEAVPPATLGQTAPASLAIADSCTGRGGPVNNIVTWRGESFVPELDRCDFTVLADERSFRRGDASDDGEVDIADAVGILGCKFLGESCPVCRDAADVSDDGQLDITDAIALLGFLFLGGPPPAPPGPTDCGLDPTPDAIPRCLAESCD